MLKDEAKGPEGVEIGALAAPEVEEVPNVLSHGMRDNPLHVVAFGEDPADAEANIAWRRGLSAAIKPLASGAVYVNGAYEQRPFAAYGANHDRLVESKTAYAPTDFLRHGQTIRPKDQAA